MDVFVLDEPGKERLLPAPEGCSDLAGFERWRTTVWGSETMRSLGAKFFPVLADNDLRVFPDQLDEFSAECSLVRSNIERLVPTPGPPGTATVLSERLRNIEAAVIRARRVGGGVLIW